MTATNLVFVADECRDAVLGDREVTLNDVRGDEAQVVIFVGYDGSVHTSGPVRLPWFNDVEAPNRRLQPLPRVLRRYPGESSTMSWLWRQIAIAWVNPGAVLPRLVKRVGRQ